MNLDQVHQSFTQLKSFNKDKNNTQVLINYLQDKDTFNPKSSILWPCLATSTRQNGKNQHEITDLSNFDQYLAKLGAIEAMEILKIDEIEENCRVGLEENFCQEKCSEKDGGEICVWSGIYKFYLRDGPVRARPQWA